MTSFFEKILEERGSLAFGKNFEKVIEGKENLSELFDKILLTLKDAENQRIIDLAISRNAASDLADNVQIAKDILEKTGLLDKSHSNGKEMLRNIELAFTGFLRRARKAGLEEYSDDIKGSYIELETFSDLIVECEEFRKNEFENTSGYLTEEENNAGGVSLRLNMAKYLSACKEKFGKRNN